MKGHDAVTAELVALFEAEGVAEVLTEMLKSQ
jgi:hypothetical protein